MSNDPIIAGAHRRGLELVAAQRRAETLLAEYQADNNEEGIAEAIGDIAAIRSQGMALDQLYNEHMQRNYQQPKERVSIMNNPKPIDEFTIEDQLEIVNYDTKRDKLTAEDLHKAVRDNQKAWDNRPGQPGPSPFSKAHNG